MFEVGFSELVMVGLVALIVIGPQKLPTVARVAGLWIGKTRNTIDQVKTEINLQLEAEELRQLGQQNIIAEQLQQTIADSEAAVLEINAAFDAFGDQTIIEAEATENQSNKTI
jgi:sec-independent protein translocase protein TatB